MLYMVIVSQPLKSTIDAGKVFVAALANPMAHVNTVGMWISYGGDGITNYSIVELEKGYEEEASKALVNYFVQYYDIDGYKVNIIPVLKPEDALEMIGITPPS
jgi:hypothetical protein